MFRDAASRLAFALRLFFPPNQSHQRFRGELAEISVPFLRTSFAVDVQRWPAMGAVACHVREPQLTAFVSIRSTTMASLGRWPIAKNLLPRTARALAAAAVVAVAPPAQAVSFQIDSASLMPGAGYGQDTGRNAENGGKQLDVAFSNTFGGLTFSLDQVGDVFTFNVGTVSFQEPDTGEGSNLGINKNEADELGVLASFTFRNPVDAIQSRTALGTAFLKAITDIPEAVDYTLTWEPLSVGFGFGGFFEIDLLDLSFSNTGSQTLTATVKLSALPQTPSVPTPTVAEPATLALFGLGLAGIGATRRRRFAA